MGATLVIEAAMSQRRFDSSDSAGLGVLVPCGAGLSLRLYLSDALGMSLAGWRPGLFVIVFLLCSG